MDQMVDEKMDEIITMVVVVIEEVTETVGEIEVVTEGIEETDILEILIAVEVVITTTVVLMLNLLLIVWHLQLLILDNMIEECQCTEMIVILTVVHLICIGEFPSYFVILSSLFCCDSASARYDVRDVRGGAPPMLAPPVYDSRRDYRARSPHAVERRVPVER
jgi:hypothetical protein